MDAILEIEILFGFIKIVLKKLFLPVARHTQSFARLQTFRDGHLVRVLQALKNTQIIHSLVQKPPGAPGSPSGPGGPGGQRFAFDAQSKILVTAKAGLPKNSNADVESGVQN